MAEYAPVQTADLCADRDEDLLAELRDFLTVDGAETPADPAFAMRLREELWELVRRQQRPNELKPKSELT